ETRVLGARVESTEDTTQGAPRPGEHASLRLFVAAPNGRPNFSFTVSVCSVAPANFGFPPCAGAPFAMAERLDASEAEARLDFVVPEDVDLGATPHALARGLICPDSGLNPSAGGSPSCLSGSGKELAFEFPLGGTDETNRNPGFTDDAFLLDGEPWLASAETSCEDGSVRQVPAKSVHAIRVSFPDTDFEPLVQPTSLDPARETLLVSPFSSAGKLDHGFLSLNPNTPPEQRRVTWTAPALADGSPTLARFYFVVRDARSGEDFASRALCVVP
ncbi:MAG TPA: hypothetical protein VHM25_00395, partial [Polyangiaceae bacterium]|nr:hypothetical protein [Polyangiaceae bacterium]